MVGYDPDGNVRILTAVFIFDTGHLAYAVKDVSDGIHVEDGKRILHYAGHSLQTHTGIDVGMSQVGI